MALEDREEGGMERPGARERTLVGSPLENSIVE